MIIYLEGYNTILRSVTIDDAKFISELRSKPGVFKYLSSTRPITEKKQKEWLVKKLAKEAGHYFIIENKFTGEKKGTISLYNYDRSEKSAEFGRYICTDSIHALVAELLIIDFSFNVANMETIYCKTVESNFKVWKQHYKFGFTDEGNEYLENKNVKLNVQKLDRGGFKKFDYSKIENLIKRFSKDQ